MTWRELLSGGVAGTVTDVVLFPLDTLKTRLQAAEGFTRAGGFKGAYKGLGAAAAGSAPGAALFFATYEESKRQLVGIQALPAPLTHMLAASMGETAACLVRVPTEVVKQRMQTSMRGYGSVGAAITSVLNAEGALGFYRGFGATLAREIPFAFVQFPIYEHLKLVGRRRLRRELSSAEAAACGSVAGAFAAFVTTPLDVAKTRLMLGRDREGVPYTDMLSTLARVRREGIAAMFAGVTPRVTWIGIGGFVFFGAYEASMRAMR